jgi:hypothetical protein
MSFCAQANPEAVKATATALQEIRALRKQSSLDGSALELPDQRIDCDSPINDAVTKRVNFLPRAGSMNVNILFFAKFFDAREITSGSLRSPRRTKRCHVVVITTSGRGPSVGIGPPRVAGAAYPPIQLVRGFAMITAGNRFDHRKTFALDEACNHGRCYHEYMTPGCRSPRKRPSRFTEKNKRGGSNREAI